MSDNSFSGGDAANSEAAGAVPEQVITAITSSEDSGEPTEGEPSEPRTFTQEELDKIIAKEKAKIERQVKRDMQQVAPPPPPAAPTYPPDPQDFDSAIEYAEALAEHKADLIVAQRESQQQQQRTNSTFAEREEAARDKYEDFEAVVYNDDLAITPAMAQVIKTSDVGPEVAYHLGKNPGEARRIAGLDPLAQAREIGKIEATLSANPPVRKTTSAPDPITPVRRGASNPAYDPTDPRSLKMDSDAWIRARNEQMVKRHS